MRCAWSAVKPREHAPWNNAWSAERRKAFLAYVKVDSTGLGCRIIREEYGMSRVALVTGGTRGIGAAITKALKARGYKVAAVTAATTKAAQEFNAETGIAVF